MYNMLLQTFGAINLRIHSKRSSKVCGFQLEVAVWRASSTVLSFRLKLSLLYLEICEATKLALGLENVRNSEVFLSLLGELDRKKTDAATETCSFREQPRFLGGDKVILRNTYAVIETGQLTHYGQSFSNCKKNLYQRRYTLEMHNMIRYFFSAGSHIPAVIKQKFQRIKIFSWNNSSTVIK